MIYNRIPMPDGLKQTRVPFFNVTPGRALEVELAADTAIINLYDEIGFFGVSAGDIVAELDKIKAPNILLRINSPGGDVFDGIAIHNDLLDHPAKVTVRVQGIAASAASIVAMAGDTIEMEPSSFMMIHNAWSITIGDKAAMGKMKEILAKIDETLAGVYAERSGINRDDLASMMDDETWMTAEQAVQLGFADDDLDGADDAGEAAAAQFDLSTFRNTPSALPELKPGAPATVRDVERTLRDAGISRSIAKEMAIRAFADKPLRDAGVMDAQTVAAFERLTETMRN